MDSFLALHDSKHMVTMGPLKLNNFFTDVTESLKGSDKNDDDALHVVIAEEDENCDENSSRI